MHSSSRGNFFAVRASEFRKSCELGLNAAVAFLTLACGTQRDNRRTTWSANAIGTYTGMTWRRASGAISQLEAGGILETVKRGARPIRSIHVSRDEDQLIWLPNELVVGAGREIPPVKRIRQMRNVTILRLLIELYSEHDLSCEGGLPRDLLLTAFSRKRIGSHGEYEVFGFNRENLLYSTWGPFVGFKDDKNVEASFDALCETGLIERVPHLVEDDEDGELLHALGGDQFGDSVAQSATSFAESLPDALACEARRYDIVLPILRHLRRATVVGIHRLRYRPKTKPTSMWYERHVEACRHYANVYSDLSRGNMRRVA